MVDQSKGYKNVGLTKRDLQNTIAIDCVSGLHETDAESMMAHFMTKA